jgi:hypothetical protein
MMIIGGCGTHVPDTRWKQHVNPNNGVDLIVALKKRYGNKIDCCGNNKSVGENNKKGYQNEPEHTPEFSRRTQRGRRCAKHELCTETVFS